MKNDYYFSKGLKQKILSGKRLLILMTTSISLFSYHYGQNGNSTYGVCRTDPPTLVFSPADCTPGNQKCVKLKFHLMNNTNQSPNSPDYNLIRELMNNFNNVYLNGNIHFSLAGECLHEGTTDGDLVWSKSAGNNTIFSHFFNESTKVLEPDPAFAYDDKAINIYLFQNPLTSGGASIQHPDPQKLFNVVYGIPDPVVLAHEIGHALGMVHTWDAFESAGSLLQPKAKWECKERGVNGNWSTTGDFLEDTGPDPYDMDLDGNNIADGLKWVTGCNPNISSGIMDGCDNDMLSWDIPFDNIMSEYQPSCRRRFSPCQLRIANDYLENEGQYLTLDCGNDPSFYTCADITINTHVVWSNLTREMCPGQKIIITSTGSLELDNTKITSKIINSNCPALSGNWDGIYIQNPNNQPYYPPWPPVNYASLSAYNGSIIEYSNNAIQAIDGHNGIFINSSKIIENPMAINAGKGNNMTSGIISIANGCEISNINFPKEVLIRSNGSDIYMDNSSLIQKRVALNSDVGIKSMDCKVDLVNLSKIKGFGYGIDNNVSGGNGQIGLTINNCRFDCIKAIRNTSSFIDVEHSFIKGKVENYGLCYGRWHSNHFYFIDGSPFLSSVEIYNPTETQTFEENRFHKSNLYLQDNQGMTDAICNEWNGAPPFGDAVSGSATKLMHNWGSVVAPSGNRHLMNSTKPAMSINANNEIKNWEKIGQPETDFDVAGNFLEDQSNGSISCQYGLFPDNFNSPLVGGNGGSYSEYNNNQNWTDCHNTYLDLQNQLATTSSSELPNLIAEWEESNECMSQAVLDGILNTNPVSDTLVFNQWISRSNPIVGQRIKILNLFRSGQYTDLISYLNSITADTSNSQDLIHFKTGINWMKDAVSDEKNIYLLKAGEQQELIDIAASTYGDYTEILRSFLNIIYDIRLNHPKVLNAYTNNKRKNVFESNCKLFITPNPTNDCIFLKDIKNSQEAYKVEIISTEGKILVAQKFSVDDPICLRESLIPGIYLARIYNTNSIEIHHLKLIMQ